MSVRLRLLAGFLALLAGAGACLVVVLLLRSTL
jgi:hypothetical protein